MSFLVIFFKDGFVCVENKEDAVLRMLARIWTKTEGPVISVRKGPTGKRSTRHAFVFVTAELVIGAY